VSFPIVPPFADISQNYIFFTYFTSSLLCKAVKIHPQNFIKKDKFIIIGEFYWLLNFLAKTKEIDFSY